MGRRKIRIQMDDGEGGKYSISLEGRVTRDKVNKLFDLMQLLDMEKVGDREVPDSVGSRIWNLVENSFQLGEFTSSELLEAYEDSYAEPIKLSVVSTYLARFAGRGALERNKGNREWLYRKIPLRH